MAGVLCGWLNGEVRLSRSLVPGSFAEEFSNGYLFGELLHKYGLQDDFNKFSQSRVASAKLNNFSLLEPTLHLLGVQFNENVAQDIMTGQHGAATKLLYELYIALEKKRKTKLTAVAMEAMRPTGPAKLKSIGSVLYQEHRIGRRRQNEIMAKIQAAIIQVPKPRPNYTIKAIEAQKLLKKKREAEDTYKEINKFEKSIKLKVPTPETTAQTATELLNVYSDDEYIRKIQKRLEEDTFAREQREKRRRKMLVEQLIAHEAQEEAYREEQLIHRLMRQSQQERRIAVQLMHVRHEKEVLRQNRIYREKQYEDRRLKEFQKALDSEAALAKQEKIDCEEQTIKERERHEKIAVGRAQARYKKHYSICWEVINQIIDLSTKVGEYRILTNNKIPMKLMRDWKEFFFSEKPIYEQASIHPLPNEPSPEQLVELNKMNLLDEKDYGEYKSMTGEWCPTEDNSENKPPHNNNILGHVLRRLMEIFYPPKPKSSLPVFPSFPIKGCILGKLFSGKTTCVKFLEKVCNIQVLSIDTLVQEAIQAFLKNEMKSEHSLISQEAESSVKQNEVSIFINFRFGYDREKRHLNLTCSSNCTLPQLSVRAQLGAASQKLLKKGKSIPDELLVAILLEAIKYEIMGWILDGFPMTINQAKLFEKGYIGVDPDEAEAEDMNPGKLSLVTDPRAPNKPPVSLPAFDVSVLLDISDTTVLKRMANAEILEEKIDLVRDQVLHRISGFLDTWPKLENWFSVHQNILVKVNAETEESLVCKAVKEILMGEIAKKQNRSKLFLPYWENIENAYVSTIKVILRCLRDEQHSIIYYLAGIRKNFQDYLKRPDLKQEFVSQWQSDFNSIADDLREDEETKAELHQRVTDLRDVLWDICDKRREEAEQECTDIMSDGWLLDHKGIAINHFFSLMQVEVDRFQDTKRLLHDYYKAMEGKIPTDDSQNFTRLPLLDIIDIEWKVPCVISKNALSCECLCADTQLPSKSKDCEWDYFSAGLPSNVPVVEVSPVPLTSEELKKQELTLKIQQEYFAALKHEEEATKSRLDLIKEKALAYIEELTVKSEEAYKDMEKWLGARFLAEMSSVEKLIEIGRHHIECSSKIQYEMTLEETDFFLSSDVKVIPDPVPPPHVPQVETSDSGTLTISQLNTFHKQFLQVAPKGFIYKKVFIDIFIEVINLNLGTNYLPDAWMNLTLPDLQNLTSAFTVNSELIDWRRFLLAAAQPWPVPSLTQLLKTLNIFKSVDVAGSGLVTQECYMQVGLWFTGNEDLNSTKDCTEPLPFDRLGCLIKFFFSLFADTRKDPALLNYIEMLLYFAAHSDPVEGVYRALSIAAGTHIHRKEESSLVCGVKYLSKILEDSNDALKNEEPLIKDENEVLKYTDEGKISLATLLKVFRDGASTDEDNHRFSSLEKEGRYDKHFIKIYKKLGTEDLTPIPVELLLKHPFIQDLINRYQEYKLIVSIAFRDHKLCKCAYRYLHYPRNIVYLDTVNLKCR
uniref:Sperm flagellar 2 n=1 Tax=Anas zonorhyncha TaxID=75864 RepID=A0A8B9VPU7_9AVES